MLKAVLKLQQTEKKRTILSIFESSCGGWIKVTVTIFDKKKHPKRKRKEWNSKTKHKFINKICIKKYKFQSIQSKRLTFIFIDDFSVT